MNVLRIIAASLSLVAAPVAAGPFSDLIVFSDSLSDVGNKFEATGGNEPGAGYFDGRFSNGPVYAERIADAFGLGPLTPSSQGGGAYAFGGGEAFEVGGGADPDSLTEQVDAYLADLGGNSADANALHVVFIGANDFFGGQTVVAVPAATIQTQMTRLAGAGARHILGINLPRLGQTPAHSGDTALSATASEFNAVLEVVYDTVESLNPAVTIYRVDLESLNDRVLDDPSRYGFTNTTGSGINAADPAGFLFWDGTHPTREAHALLGEAAIRAALPAGDFNRDGFVNGVDYYAWVLSRGAAFDAQAGVTTGVEADANGDGRVDAADYTVLRDAISAAAASVPEPTAGAIFALTAVSAAACSRSRRAPSRSR